MLCCFVSVHLSSLRSLTYFFLIFLIRGEGLKVENVVFWGVGMKFIWETGKYICLKDFKWAAVLKFSLCWSRDGSIPPACLDGSTSMCSSNHRPNKPLQNQIVIHENKIELRDKVSQLLNKGPDRQIWWIHISSGHINNQNVNFEWNLVFQLII